MHPETRTIEFKELTSRFEQVFKPAFQRHFDGTAVVDNTKEWGPDDVTNARAFLEELIAVGHEKMDPSFVEHIILAEVSMGIMARLYNHPEELNEYEARVLGDVHDDEVPVLPHYNFFRNVLTDHAVRQLGVRTELWGKLDPVVDVVGLYENERNINSVDQMSAVQRIHCIADNFGKLNKNGKLLAPTEYKEYLKAQEVRYRGDLSLESIPWKLSRLGLKRMHRQGRREVSETLTLGCLGWFEGVTGKSLSDIQTIIWDEYSKPENIGWVKRIQETYFKPEVQLGIAKRELLKWPDTELVLFDAGNVLIKDPGDALWASVWNSLDSKYSLNKDQKRIFDSQTLAEPGDQSTANKLLEMTMNGTLNVSDFLHYFYILVDIPKPEDYNDALQPFIHPELYTPISGMQDVIHNLIQRGVKVGILSDCSNVLIPGVSEQLHRLYPEIPLTNMLFSGEIKSAKRDKNTQAFDKALLHFRIDNPRKVLFIDDKPEYIDAAKINLLLTYHFKTTDMASQLSTLIDSQPFVLAA